MNIDRFVSHQDYVELTDDKGEQIDWIITDFRNKPFSKYTPEQIKVMAMINKDEETRKWLILTVILWILALISWYGIWK